MRREGQQTASDNKNKQLDGKDFEMGNTLPLKGIKVASLAWIGVGPLGIRYLAHWGATVVRIESHRRIDTMRQSRPFSSGIQQVNQSPWFAQANGAVFGVSIDLTRRSGLDIAWRLIKWADVLAESFTPGTMAKLGLDYKSVSKVKPDIVYISTCQMGQTGPLAKFGGFGFHGSAMAGITHLTGWPDRDPTPHAVAFVDALASRYVGVGALAALEYRRRTGRGQHLDVSQCECGIQNIAPVVMDYMVNGHSAMRSGNSLPYAAPHGVYPCKGDDRWSAIAVFDDEQWLAFCGVVNQEWTGDTKYSSLLARKQNEVELNEIVGKWTINHTAEEVESLMQAAGVPCHVVSNSKDVFEDPQMRHRKFFRELPHSVMEPHTYYTHGFKLSKVEGNWRTGPALGEHNEYVFKELLGMTDDEIADALIDGGITTDADLVATKKDT
jgi:benzylsuccinate CoA-transferase BbsF subunit